MIVVSKRTHDALWTKHKKLIADHAQLVKDHAELQTQLNTAISLHQEVIEERNDTGTLLLDCLSLLNSITISKRQNALIVERETLVERAKELGYLPGKEEEQEEGVTNG